MTEQVTRRQLLIGAGAVGTLSPLLVPGAVLAREDKRGAPPGLVRWDTVNVTETGVVLPCGSDVAQDAASGDMVTISGSGQAEPTTEEAAGGGSFLHQSKSGKEVAHGFFFVTRFQSFRNAGGTLVGAGVQDAIGELDDTTGGVLVMDVHLVPASGAAHDGVLTVFCHLPGTSGDIKEGVSLTVAGTPLKFLQNAGNNLFHIISSH
jgi:hypothetical protein